MAFLIEGREMPKNCMSCYSNNTHVYIHMLVGCPYIKEAFHNYNIKKERHPDCPLVSVPEPHGRLGDLDALMLIIREYIDEYGELDENGFHSGKWCAMKEAEMVICEAPTVIPASKEGET